MDALTQEKLTVVIDKGLKRKFKAVTKNEGHDMTFVLTNLLNDYIKKGITVVKRRKTPQSQAVS